MFQLRPGSTTIKLSSVRFQDTDECMHQLELDSARTDAQPNFGPAVATANRTSPSFQLAAAHSKIKGGGPFQQTADSHPSESPIPKNFG